MLATALADPDPVLIFEHVMLYNLEGWIPAHAEPVDIHKAKVHREGSDVTLLAYGAGFHKAMTAAATLAEAGINAEVIDLRCLRPLDDETLMASVAKTRRAIIVDEGWRSGGISAEIMARIMEQCFYELDAPVMRICGAEVPIPYPKHLEDAALPQPERIVQAVKEMLGRG